MFMGNLLLFRIVVYFLIIAKNDIFQWRKGGGFSLLNILKNVGIVSSIGELCLFFSSSNCLFSWLEMQKKKEIFHHEY